MQYEVYFHPSTINQWKNIEDIRNNNTKMEFKQFLKINDIVVPSYCYSLNREPEKLHAKLRLKCSDLNSDM